MFPHEIKSIDGKVGEELVQQFKGQQRGFVKVSSKNWTLTEKYRHHAEKYFTFKLRPDDLWIMSYPRSGSTWTQELLWLINNNLDYEKAAEVPLITRSTFLEFNMIYCDDFLKKVEELNKSEPAVVELLRLRHSPGYITAESQKSPRQFKTHLPPSLMPPSLFDTCKVVYVARNPLDVAVSFYHHNKLSKGFDYQGDFEKYWEYFEKDLLIFTPYWEHIKEGWKYKDHPNCLFLFYEDLIRDLPSVIKRVCKFLNKEMTDDEIKKLAAYLQIDNFRQKVNLVKGTNESANISPLYASTKVPIGLMNPNAQGFFRRGKVGGNIEMEGEIKVRAEKWFKENLAKTDIQFPEF